MRRPSSLVSLLLMISAAIVAPAHGSDWPRWLGPNQDGKTSGDARLASGSFGLEVAWSKPLGIGYSGIAVAGGRAVTIFGDGEFDWLVAVDAANGEEIWRYKIDAMFPAIGGSEGSASSMPVVDGGVVYGLGAKGHLFAVGLDDGDEKWTLRIDEQLGARAPHFGFATTPLVVGDLLIVETGGDAGRSLAAFDKATGDLSWSTGDDVVGYQSPIPARLADREQIVAVTNVEAYGLVAETGEVLWRAEHGLSAGDDGYSTPVLLGDDSFLLTGQQESKAFRLVPAGASYELEELWTSTNLKRSFATPLLHEGHLYGFDGDFLTCIDPATGDKVWKSRPPGGRGLILVDGYLIVFANDGEVVVAAASPEGYEEKARLAAAKAGSFTYPSYADGIIFVRNTKEFAGVRIGDARPAPRVTAVAESASHEFGRFVAIVEQSGIKRLLIDDYMADQARFPIVEDDRWVHFVYRGDVDDVAVTGSMLEYQLEDPLARIEGTDFHHRSYPIEPGARWEYQYNVDFENTQPDPLNPRRIPGDEGDLSEVLTTGWKAPGFTEPYLGDRPGSIDSFTWTSEILGNERQVDLYLPPGFDKGQGSYPLLVLNDGKDWLEKGNLANSLNQLIGNKIVPVVVAFVEAPQGFVRDEFGGPKSADYVRMLTEELVPHLQKDYRIEEDAASHAVMGAGSGAFMAAWAAVERPDVFGKAVGCSLYLARPNGEKLLEMVAAADSDERARFWLAWNEYELRREEWGIDLGQDTQRLAEALDGAGYEVAAGKVLDSAGWGGWRVRAGEMLVELYPR